MYHKGIAPSHSIYLAMYFALWKLDIWIEICYLINHNIGTVSEDTMISMYNQCTLILSNPESKLIDICRTGPEVLGIVCQYPQRHQEATTRTWARDRQFCDTVKSQWSMIEPLVGKYQVLEHPLNYFQLAPSEDRLEVG